MIKLLTKITGVDWIPHIMLLKLDTINPYNSQIIPLDNHQLYFIVRDHHNDLWGGSSNGLLKYEYQPGEELPFKLSNLFVYNRDRNSINNNFIRSLCVDNSNILWIGTNGGGVSKYNPGRTKIRHYKNTGQAGSLSANKVFSIYEDKHLNVWFGTEGGGLNLLPSDKKKDYNTGFTHIDVNPAEQQNFVFDIIDVSNQGSPLEIWAGVGYNNRLIRIKQLNQSWNVEKVMPEAQAQVMSVCKDEFGTIWVGTYYAGLEKYQPNVFGGRKVQFLPSNNALPSDIIRSVFEDSRGRLWVGTSEGLMLLTREQKRKEPLEFTLFTSKPDDTTSISHNYIVPILETSVGEIWAGTFGGGINRYIEGETETSGHFQRVLPLEALPNNNIKKIIEDKQGDFWISTNKGISHFEPTTGLVRNYNISDGLQDMEFTDMSGCMLHDGEILFGGVNGFNAFYPEDLFEDSIPPKVVFTDLRIKDNVVQIGKSYDGNIVLKNNLNVTEAIKLKHTQSTFTIHFAALHFGEPMSNSFKYMLVGLEDEWVSTNANSRFARYTNIDAGKYTFKVMAANSDAVWSLEPHSIVIYIQPPFWLTIWFRVLVFLVLLGSVSAIVWFRFYLIKQRNELLEKEVRKRTQEINKQKEQLEDHAILLNETNTQLEERQQLIEEQAEELRAQKDSLIVQSDKLYKQKTTLEQQKTTLEEMNASKDKFYSILAHDLKGPFTTILGYIELLIIKNKVYDEETRKRRLEYALKSSKVIYKLVEDLLHWSRSQRGVIPFNPSLINVDNLISEVLKIYQPSLEEKGIALEYLNQDKSSTVLADEDMLRTVLRNLLSNAIKYTHPGGCISIQSTKEQKAIIFKVSDNGVGIPADVVSTIFRVDNTYTTEGTNAEKGTGLGLVLCKDFVEKHKGRIWVESEEDKGTTFFVSLPA